ncbi:MAG: hypothetical protein ACI9NQ_001079 [Paracoccaceae bacterium]|jgi:hypothetical protein
MNPLKIALFALLSACLPVSAEMVFKSLLVEIDAKAGENQVTGEFPFEIKGDSETIVSYDALCTCLAGRVEPLLADRSPKLHWKAGEKGVIKARFDTSRFLGTVDKALELKLNGRDPVILTVRVNIPDLVQLEPNTLRWETGGEADEKVIKITVNHTKPIKIISHSSNKDEIYPYELKTIKEGWEYEIRVQPRNTIESGMGMISLRTDCEIPKFKRAIVYVVTKPKLKVRPVVGAVK